MPDDNFADAMTRAKGGVPAAIRDFLRRFEMAVRTMVRAWLPKKPGTQVDSLDIVQALSQGIFSDLPRHTLDFLKVNHLHGLLAVVVRNDVYEQYGKLTRTAKYNNSRRERLYIGRGDRDLPREVISPDPSPGQAAQASAPLAQLTEGSSPREVKVIMFRRERFTYDDIAAQMGLNEKTVPRIIDSARSRMEAG
jgi:DNA-directed RNA polymerase specialized sigma24 family protein